jgi:hypothetical protein
MIAILPELGLQWSQARSTSEAGDIFDCESEGILPSLSLPIGEMDSRSLR